MDIDARNQDAYPSLVPGPNNGPGWTVLECQDIDSRTNPEERMLAIPKALTRHQGEIRLHELGHVRRAQLPGNKISDYGPEPRRSIRKMIEEIALDCDWLAIGMDIRTCRDGLDWANLPKPQDRLARACMVLQLIGSIPATKSQELRDFYSDVGMALDFADALILDQCFKDICRDFTVRNCDTWADILAAHFSPPPPDTKAPSASASEKDKQREAQEEAKEAEQAQKDANAKQGTRDANDEQHEDNGEPEEPLEPSEQCSAYNGHLPKNVRDTLDIHWHVGGRAPSRAIASAWRMTEQSGPLRYPTQAMRPDGRPFGSRAAGGCVIIDMSASMSWQPAELERAIRDMLNLTVGVYCGTGAVIDPGTMTFNLGNARLCIIGHKGRMADFNRDSEPFNGSNGRSDWQAISAMMRIARGPYVWVSDGQVHFKDIAGKIKAEMDRGQIVRTRTVQHAIQYLQYKTVPLARTLDANTPGLEALEMGQRRS